MDKSYTEKEVKIMQSLLDRNGIQHIVDVAAEVFENPIFVCDLGCKIICRSNTEGTQDEFWKQMKKQTYSTPEKISSIMRTGDFVKVYSSDTPRIGQYPFAEHQFLAARIRDANRPMGHICVYGCNRSFCKEDEELLVILCKVISYEMLYRGLSASFKIPYYSLLLDLLEGNLTTKEELQTRLQCMKLEIPDKSHLIVIDFKDTVVQSTINYVREFLIQGLNHTLGIVFKSYLLLLAPYTVVEQHLLEEELAGYEGNIDYQIGVSNQIGDFLELPIYFQQAVEAIEISKLLKRKDKVCLYNHLKIYQILCYARKEIDLKYLCDPVVLEIMSYDQKNHTEYLKDLELYLRCGKNINQAAQIACVHKNSMYYRISKLEEKFSLSLEDAETCLSMQLSFKILELLKS